MNVMSMGLQDKKRLCYADCSASDQEVCRADKES